MEKLFKIMGAILAMLALPAEERDKKELEKTVRDYDEFMQSDEAKGYTGSKELTEQLAQLRKDLDASIESQRKLEKSGLARQDRRIKVLGYKEIMDLRRVQRVFPDRETARHFGAICCRSIFSTRPNYTDMVPESTRGLADELVKDLDPGVSGSGAELVANLYMADMIAHVEAVGVLFPQCDRVPLQTTGTTYWPKLTGELTAYPTATAAKITESSPTFATVDLTPVKWGTLTPIPNEFFRNPTLLDALGQRLAWLITRAISYAFDNALVNGDGTADYGNIMGILQDVLLTSITAGAAATIGAYTGAEIGAVIAGVTKDYVSDPRWWMHLSSERTLRNIRSTTGTPLYDRGNNGEPNTIDNYPYTTCQRFTAAGSVGAAEKWAAFGDLRLSHYFGMMGGIEIAQSEHVRFENDMTVIRGLAYADAALKDADALIVAKTHA